MEALPIHTTHPERTKAHFFPNPRINERLDCSQLNNALTTSN